MSAFVDSLNLRPQEKRVIVVIGVVVFVALNFVFVFPQFKEKARVERQLRNTRKTISDFQSKIAMDDNTNNGYQVQLSHLQKQEGGESGQFGGDIQLQRTIAELARSTGVSVQNYEPVNTYHIGTNAASQFFERQSMSITAMAKEEGLVNFLYRIGNDPAMIRVKELTLRPADANRYELNCRITFTADYKKAARTAPEKSDAPILPTAKLPGAATPKPAAPTGVPARGIPPAGFPGRVGLPSQLPGRAAGPPPMLPGRAAGPPPMLPGRAGPPAFPKPPMIQQRGTNGISQ